MNNSNLENINNQSNNEKDDYEIINFNYWFNLILRNKLLVGSLTFITVTLVVLYSLTLKRVWKGQFEIVLNTDNQQQSQRDSLMALAGIAGLDRISKKGNDLKTEVEILQSPSVLMPIFQYSQTLKNNNKKKANFSDWKKKKLKIKLKEQTKVLEISYQDTNKKTIISVLNMMGDKYQEYSGRNTKRDNELTNNYLKNQILYFRKKSSESLKKAQEFATDQDLVFKDIYSSITSDNNNPVLNENNQQVFSIMNIDLEKIRFEAANSIRVIDLQLEKLKDLENASDIQFIVSSIPFLVEQNLPNNLIDIDKELSILRSKYTEDSEPIKRALERRELTINFLKNRAIDFLKSARSEAESRMEAAMRPKGVLLKYKELIREAYRDETTLVSLENQLRKTELESSRQMDPWELITRPTLLNSPVAPNKKQMAFFALIISLFFSTLLAYYKEKKSGIIFVKDDLNGLFYPIEPIFEINLEDQDEVNQDIILLKNIISYQSSKKISFLSVGNIKSNLLEKFKNSLLSFNTNKELEVTKLDQNLKFGNKDQVCYVLTKLGSIKNSDISFFKKNMELLNIPIKGFIILN